MLEMLFLSYLKLEGKNTTLDILKECGIHCNLVLGSIVLTECVTECRAVMSQERKLVNSGDFIEVVTSQQKQDTRT